MKHGELEFVPKAKTLLMLQAWNKFQDWIVSVEGQNLFRKGRYPNWEKIALYVKNVVCILKMVINGLSTHQGCVR